MVFANCETSGMVEENVALLLRNGRSVVFSEFARDLFLRNLKCVCLVCLCVCVLMPSAKGIPSGLIMASKDYQEVAVGFGISVSFANSS